MKLKTFLFLHIPKNSGTSIKKIVRRFHEQDEVYFIYERRIEDGVQVYDMNDFLALSDAEKKRIKVFFGHFTFGLHNLIPQPCSYMTVLRDPVERVISLFYYVSIEEYNNRYLKRIKSENMTLQDFVRRGVAEEADNYQTRVISGMKAEYGKCTREMLETAQYNLQKYFVVVGLSEYFEESVLLMRKALGWNVPFLISLKNRFLKLPDPFYERTNVTPNRPRKAELSSDELKTIDEFNGLDMELYKYGEKLFREQLKQFGISCKGQENIMKFSHL